jgi:hypothetical protein
MLADLVDERRPDIDPTPYSPTLRNRHRSRSEIESVMRPLRLP